MGALSIWHVAILAVVGLLLFGGRGKISDLMGDLAKGVKSFRNGLADDPEHEAIANQAAPSPMAAAPVQEPVVVRQ